MRPQNTNHSGGVKIHFLTWDKPALEQAVDFLTTDWCDGSLDLSDQLIVVPTRHAGRRLRERLALVAAEKDGAVFPGRIATPEILFAPRETSQPVVDAISASLIWQQVLKSSQQLPDLFPHGAPLDDLTIRCSIAEQLIELRTLLCDEGHTIRSFAAAYTDNPEAGRWNDLVTLEQKYLKELDALNLLDDSLSKIDSALAPALDPAFRSLCMLFVSDPPSLAITALKHLQTTLPMDLCVHAPEALHDLFDEWGHPKVEVWAQRSIPICDRQIVLSNNSFDQIDFVTDYLANIPPEQRTRVAIGVPDHAQVPGIQAALKSREMDSFNPAGTSVGSSALYGLIEALILLAMQRDYDSFARLVRHPFFLDYLGRRVEEFKSITFLKKMDLFQNTHLPADYDAVRSFATAAPGIVADAVRVVDQCLELLKQDDPAETLQNLLTDLFEGCRLNVTRRADHDFVEVARCLEELLNRFRAIPALQQITPTDRMLLLLNELRKQRITDERSPTAIDLPGWLELPWENTSQLIVTGMADGHVPETIVGHPFLPDEARSKMGLRDNARRLARDAYLLSILLHSRSGEGDELILCFSKKNGAGDPLKPSRLLLQCAPQDLAKRTLFLFGECPEQSTGQAREQDWLLTPPPPGIEPPRDSFSITALSDYLACPFGYYLKHVRRMKPCDDSKEELDALDFGLLCHQALAALVRPEIATCVSEKELADFLHNEVTTCFRQAFGERLSLPLIIQRDTLYKRLNAAARVECESRRNGWQIEYAEKKWEMSLGGYTLAGRIDRIDRNESGRWRILDYKTSNKVILPKAKHLKKKRTPPEDYMIAPDGLCWTDLQLPLYAALFLHEHPAAAPLECGYFMLPKNEPDTGIYEWSDLDNTLIQSATTCASSIIQRISKQIFWPPLSIDRDRTFGALFFDTAGETVSSNQWSANTGL